jgi:hypothetical protein
LSVLAALGLASALAFGGTVVGCGSSSGNGRPEDSGSGGGDTGSSSGTADTGTKDTGSSSGADTGGGSSGADSSGSSSGPDTGPTCTTTLSAPTFTPPDGTIVNPGDSVTINPPSGFPSGGTIFFTTNGTIPNHNSSVYIGPIQITASPTTIFAIASAPGDCDSPSVHATYTINKGEPPIVPSPVFNPTSQSQNNDFLVSLSTAPGDTICYRLDGNTPTCSNGTCTGGSQTYNGATQVSINGSVTDPTTGKVTVTAIACDAGGDVSGVVTQVYQLIVADPTMVNPQAAANIPYVNGGLKPTISTVTVTSNETSSIWYTTTAAAPTCITGTQVANPTTFNGSGTTNPPIATNTTIQALGCKQGYLHSNVVPFAYTIQLNMPTLLANGTYHFTPAISQSTALVDNGLNDLPNTGSSDVICASLSGDPSCKVNAVGAAGCNAGTQVTSAAPFTIGNATSANNTLKVIACAPSGLNSSAEATGTYTLQYAATYVYTTDHLVSPVTDLPGWDWAGASTPAGQPVTGFKIPSSYPANTAYPAAGFTADTVQNIKCTGTAGTGIQSGTLPQGSCPATAPGATAYAVPDFYCFSTTGAAACSCTGTNKVAAGSGDVSLGATSAIKAAGQLSVLPCQNATPTIAYASPNPTTITASSATQATKPTVQQPTSNPFNAQAAVSITNNDTTNGGSTLCVNVSANNGTAPADPTCTAGGTCTTGELCWSGTTWVVSNGANCAITPASGQTGNSVTLPTGPGPGANAGRVQIDNETIKAVACNTILTASPVDSALYNFKAAKPDFTSAGSTAIGDLNGATSIGAGAVVNLSSTSNFDLATYPLGGAAAKAEAVHFATGATANCGSPGTVSLTSVTQPGGAGTPLVTNWPVGGANPTAPTSGTTWTLTAVTCGQNDSAIQQTSDPRTVTFNLTAAQPVLTTNQDPTGTGCGTGCAPITPYETTFNVILTSTTPGQSICYTTNGTAPTCTAGVCGGTPAPNTGVTIPITASGTNVQAIGCLANLPASGITSKTFVLNTDVPVVSSSTVTCNGSTNIGLSQAQTDTGQGGPTPNACVCYSTNGQQPSCTPGAVQGACSAVNPDANTTCFGSGGGGTNTAAVTVTSGTTVKMVSCKTGFNPVLNNQAYSINPYVNNINPDGNLGDWVIAAEGMQTYWHRDPGVGGGNGNTFASNAAGGGSSVGYFTYNATNVYMAFDPGTSNLYNTFNTGYGRVAYVGYFGTAGSTGASVDLPIVDPADTFSGFDNRVIEATAGIQYAFMWQQAGPAPLTYQWDQPTLTWKSTSIAVQTGFSAGAATAEFGIPLASIGTPGTLTAYGDVFFNVPAAGTTCNPNPQSPGGPGTPGACPVEGFRWPGPGGGFSTYTLHMADNRSSCLNPNGQVAP